MSPTGIHCYRRAPSISGASRSFCDCRLRKRAGRRSLECLDGCNVECERSSRLSSWYLWFGSYYRSSNRHLTHYESRQALVDVVLFHGTFKNCLIQQSNCANVIHRSDSRPSNSLRAFGPFGVRPEKSFVLRIPEPPTRQETE